MIYLTFSENIEFLASPRFCKKHNINIVWSFFDTRYIKWRCYECKLWIFHTRRNDLKRVIFKKVFKTKKSLSTFILMQFYVQLWISYLSSPISNISGHKVVFVLICFLFLSFLPAKFVPVLDKVYELLSGHTWQVLFFVI